MVEPEGPQMMSQYVAYKLHAGYARLHACTPPCARTHAHNYVIFIAFPRQQWFVKMPHFYVIPCCSMSNAVLTHISEWLTANESG
jgi:hypothetical protein